jgi:hypothetical protein
LNGPLRWRQKHPVAARRGLAHSSHSPSQLRPDQQTKVGWQCHLRSLVRPSPSPSPPHALPYRLALFSQTCASSAISSRPRGSSAKHLLWFPVRSPHTNTNTHLQYCRIFHLTHSNFRVCVADGGPHPTMLCGTQMQLSTAVRAMLPFPHSSSTRPTLRALLLRQCSRGAERKAVRRRPTHNNSTGGRLAPNNSSPRLGRSSSSKVRSGSRRQRSSNTWPPHNCTGKARSGSSRQPGIRLGFTTPSSGRRAVRRRPTRPAGAHRPLWQRQTPRAMVMGSHARNEPERQMFSRAGSATSR